MKLELAGTAYTLELVEGGRWAVNDVDGRLYTFGSLQEAYDHATKPYILLSRSKCAKLKHDLNTAIEAL